MAEVALPKSRTLAGVRIVVTRAPEQSRDLVARFEALGVRVISLPAIAFEEPLDSKALDEAIRALEAFEWVLFTSSNAARFFARRCRALGFEIGRLKNADKPVFVAAVGPATSEAAAAEGFVVGHMAEEFRSSELAMELKDQLQGRRVLLPRSDLASPELPAMLREAGAHVTEVVAYRTVPAREFAPSALDALRQANADAVVFFSASAFRSLLEKIGRESLQCVAIAAVGPVTAAAIREAGLSVTIEARRATTEALVTAVEEYFAVREPKGVRTV